MTLEQAAKELEMSLEEALQRRASRIKAIAKECECVFAKYVSIVFGKSVPSYSYGMLSHSLISIIHLRCCG